jgi:two-component system chemotaxis response regulator CheY
MERANLASARVLLVGEKNHTLALLRSVLNIAGVMNITHAEDSERAVYLLRMENFSAVFCDQQAAPIEAMPFPLAARRLTGMHNPMLPIFVLKERAHRQDVEKARDIGATDFVTVPISPKTVINKLQAAITAPRPFIVAPEFFGPDRRAQRVPFHGTERRKRVAKKTKIDLANGPAIVS